MPLIPNPDQDALYLSRSDPGELLGCFSEHSFKLEDKEWPTVEHYYQAMKFEDNAYQETIRQAPTAKKARKLGRSRFHKIRSDWKKIKEVVMTRGVYIKCRTYPVVAEQLLNTKERKIVENNLYDYFWGCGRDRRGENKYGQVLMNVREKLKSELD